MVVCLFLVFTSFACFMEEWIFGTTHTVILDAEFLIATFKKKVWGEIFGSSNSITIELKDGKRIDMQSMRASVLQAEETTCNRIPKVNRICTKKDRKPVW